MRAINLLSLLLALCACQPGSSTKPPGPEPASPGLWKRLFERASAPEATPEAAPEPPRKRPRDYLVAHVFVALCDNENQGIVPTGKALGNGQNPDTNLYWGAGYGVRTFFNKKRGWRRLEAPAPACPVLERRVWRKTLEGKTLILIADAYDGAYIEQTTRDFLTAAAGALPYELEVNDPEAGEALSVQAGGFADLVAYVGHNGLMDFPVPEVPAQSSEENPKEAVILACIADAYFEEPLARAGTTPLVWTTNLMAPEAYTLEAILNGRLLGKSKGEIREMAAQAYAHYQDCGIKAARRLLTGN